jgi:hypothetical protein
MATPTCTKATTTKVVKLIRMGIPPSVAAEAHGIDQGEFVEWMRKGQLSGSGHGNFRQFYEEVCKAEADFEARLVSTISTASIGDWKAAAWLAERRFPERYVRKPVSEASGPKPATGDADPWDQVDKVVPLKAVT